jgi:ankyrin repeat protein
MTAARTGNAAAVSVLIGHGANVNVAEQWRGQTALMWAAAQGHASVVGALVKAGADVHARSKTRTPYAALPAGVDPLDYYTEQGSMRPVPPNTDPAVGPPGFSPLLFAVRAGHLTAVTALLAAGANANDTLTDGTSALVLAVLNAHYDVGKLLLENGADPNADLQGWTALHQLVWTRRPALQRALPSPLPTGDVTDLEFLKVLAAHGANVNARQKREPDDANRHAMDRTGATPFLLAAKAADAEMMRALVAVGADPRLTTAKRTTPLMAAAGVGIWRIGESPGTNEEALDAVKLAFELAGDINAVDANGDTALHGAAHRGATAIVQFLHDHGAKLDAVNSNGWTALTIAEGVLHPNTYKSEPATEALLRQLGASASAGKRRREDMLATGVQKP